MPEIKYKLAFYCGDRDVVGNPKQHLTRMRSVKIFIALIFICKFSYSANDTSHVKHFDKVIVYISGGATIPTGNFSRFEVNDGVNYTGTNMAGAAKVGFNDRFNVVYLISKTFGVNFIIFDTDNKATTPDSTDLFYDPCPICHGLGGGSTRQSFSYRTSTWATSGFLLGLVTTLYNNSFTLLARITSGVQKVGSPETRLIQEGYIWQINWNKTYPYSSDVTQPSLSSKYNFAFGGGVDIIVALSRKLRIIGSIDYLTSKASFSGNLIETYYSGYNLSTYERQSPFSFDKNISQFNINAGIGYKIL